MLSGAAPGCLLNRGGGGKIAKRLATAARAIQFCASPEKVAQRGGGGGGGGDSDSFFFDFKTFSTTFSFIYCESLLQSSLKSADKNTNIMIYNIK